MSIAVTSELIRTHPLTRNRQLAAWWRVASWQIKSRLKRRHVLPWINGSKIVAERGWHGATGNIYAGLHEYEPMRFLLDTLKPGDLFVDGGANVGSYTILASAVCGTRTIAIEPIADIQACVVANRMGERVQVIKKALSSHPGSVLMTTGNDTMNRISDTGNTEIEAIVLDSLETPALLKLDLEGSEDRAIQGARRMLSDRALKAILIETHGEKLREFGFSLYDYDPTQKAIAPATRQTGAMGLWIRDLDFVASRLVR